MSKLVDIEKDDVYVRPGLQQGYSIDMSSADMGFDKQEDGSKVTAY